MIGGTGWGRGLVLGGLACAALAAGCGGEGDPGPAAPTIASARGVRLTSISSCNSPSALIRNSFPTAPTQSTPFARNMTEVLGGTLSSYSHFNWPVLSRA